MKISRDILVFGMLLLTFAPFSTSGSDIIPASTDTQQDVDAASLASGELLYRQGIGTSGPIVGRVSNDVALSGEKVACVGCHRRSGLGSSEANILIPPVTGAALFDSSTPWRQTTALSLAGTKESREKHPAYTEATFAAALRNGVNSAGQPLKSLMPRYEISDSDLTALSVYLKSLSASPDPGVDAETIHFASVIMPDVSPERRKAMLDVLTAYIQDINASPRLETRRAAHPPWHKDWQYRSYRKWELHVWDLSGQPATWPNQLAEYYRRQPVFALLGGAGSSNWRPVHEFCEQHAIPCVFPSTDLPVITDTDFYTLYFSKGIFLEAEALAAHLSQKMAQPPSPNTSFRIVQIFRGKGNDIATAFRKALSTHGIQNIHDLDLNNSDLSHVLNPEHEDETVFSVYWLGADDLHTITRQNARLPHNHERYFSSSLIGTNTDAIPSALKHNAYLLQPFAPRDQWSAQLARTSFWLRSKHIAFTDQRLQADTLFTATLTKGVLHELRGNFSRDYFIENIEHMIDNTLEPSVYPKLTLGPRQRYASKGCYIISLDDDRRAEATPVLLTP